MNTGTAHEASATSTPRRPVGMWGKAVRKLVSSNAEYENDALALAARSSGCATLSDCGSRQLVTLQGRLGLVTLGPRGTRSWLEAELQDGTGSLTLVWMGRRSIPGIEAGRMMRVTGRLATRGRDKVMFNPDYELLG